MEREREREGECECQKEKEKGNENVRKRKKLGKIEKRNESVSEIRSLCCYYVAVIGLPFVHHSLLCF